MCRSQPVQCTIWCGFDNRRNPIFSPLCRLYSDWNVWCSSGLKFLRPPIPKVWSDLIRNREKSLRLMHVTFEFLWILSLCFFYIIFIANTRTQDEKRQKQQEKRITQRGKGKTHEILFHLSSLCWFNIFHTAISPNTRFAMFNFRFDFLFFLSFLLLFSPPPLCFPFELEDIFRSFLLRPLPRPLDKLLILSPFIRKWRKIENT